MAVSASLVLLLAMNSKAATVTSRVSATVVKPTFTINCNALSFGNIIRVIQAGTIQISPQGNRQINDQIEMGAMTHKASSCQVSGPPDTSYTAKAPKFLNFSPSASFVGPSQPASLIVSDIHISSKNSSATSNDEYKGTSDNNGKDELYVGATLHVPQNAAPGLYEGVIPITIHY